MSRRWRTASGTTFLRECSPPACPRQPISSTPTAASWLRGSPSARGPCDAQPGSPGLLTLSPRQPVSGFEGWSCLLSRPSAYSALTAPLYTQRMAEEPTDAAALFARLKEYIRAAGPRGDDVPPAQVRLSVRAQAE